MVKVYGLVVTIPKDVGVGAADPAGTINISHEVAVPCSVQLNTADVCVTLVAVKLIGLGHVGKKHSPVPLYNVVP